MNRRNFLQLAGIGASVFAAPYQRAAAALKKKVKITDVKMMIVRGTWDWNLIKVETDSGLYGIGEAYWGWGVKDLVLNKMQPIIVGEDPLNVDKLYTKMLMQSAGAGAIGGVTITAASGIEIALWDLCGRILETPVCNLLGGRFPRRVRFYRTLQAVDKVEDMSAWRDQIQEAKAEPWGWTAFKFQGDGIPPRADPQYTGTRSRPLWPQPDQQGLSPHRNRDADRSRDTGTRCGFRRRVSLEIRCTGRDPARPRLGAGATVVS
jgi:L-alanine-DL-glutamate epimerase-like enolase superfamily enzyme